MFTQQPTHAYLAANTEAGTIGHSPEWQQLLAQGLGSRPLYFWDAQCDDGVALTVFKRAFFHIGFIGFPFGGTVRERPLTTSWVQKLQHANCDLPLHALRIIASPFYDQLTLPIQTEAAWETAIVDLPNWQSSHLKSSVRRNIKKAEKSGLWVKQAETTDDIAQINAQYQATIARRKGNLRYTHAYFAQLVQLAQRLPNLQCFLAMAEQEVAGFLIAVQHGTAVFYLHGGTNLAHQANRPSDLLFDHAIQWAKERGSQQFNFMGSPISQPSLVHFKEKWGGVTKKQHTFNLTRPSIGGHLFQLAFNIHIAIQRRQEEVTKSNE